MSAVNVKLEHVGVGCNRVVHALHWGSAEGLLAYGAHNAVVVYHPEEARVMGTLLGHTDVVTCVRWLPPVPPPGGQQHPPAAPAEAALASGSGDCSVRVWRWTPHTPHQPWRLAAVLEGHTAPVTSLATHLLPSGGLLLVSTAGDGDVLVWECSGYGSQGGEAGQALGQAGWRLCQRISLGHQLQDCAAIAPLPADPGWLLLALGGVDAAVRLYCCPPGGQFEAVCKLTGHQDWVKGLAFAQLDDGKLLLASASQDKYVRVWAITQQQQQQAHSNGADAANGRSTAPALDLSSLAQSLTRYAPKPAIRAGQHSYTATLESLLIGHEDWVHSVDWHPRVPRPDGCGTSQPPCLLTASMDRTMMMWRPDPGTGLWMCEESVGDAGANHLGYYTGVFSPDGGGIAAHGFTGALHLWKRQAAGGWLPQHALGGHFAPVVDACWAADGGCLLTVSTDQTARITARLSDGHWCEIARPQVHGHDFSSVAAIPCSSSDGAANGQQQQGAAAAAVGAQEAAAGQAAQGPRYLYASGSEEKVIRVFEAPRAFRDTLAMARGLAAAGSSSRQGQPGAALGASLPALGLSNKAVYDEEPAAAAAAGAGDSRAASGGLIGVGADAYAGGADLVPQSAPSAVAGPPLEEHLAQNTLWPEIHKLYGHGNELYCLAADPLGRYIASACRAQSSDTAAIWLWDTSKWVGAAQLAAHTLTVTQLAFCPDGRYLASASRDRTVALFERQPGGAGGGSASAVAPGGQPGGPFRLLGRIKAHARIVWGLHWSPDSRLLATASRDGKVKVWSLAPGAPQPPQAPAAVIECGDSVRSVQFAPHCQPSSSYWLAAGLESGAVHLLHLTAAPVNTPERGEQQQQQQLAVVSHDLLWRSSEFERHAAAVRRLCWRRDTDTQDGAARYQLASCSDDHALRVFSVTL